jgi:hypothetical protein
MYDKYLLKEHSNGINNQIFTSKMARRLLVLVFVQICHQRINQIERLNKLIPLIFRSNDHQVTSLIYIIEFMFEENLDSN